MRNIIERLAAAAAVCLLALALTGCGGGGGGELSGGSGTPTPPPANYPALPLQGSADAGNAPVTYEGRFLTVNPGVAPATAAVPTVTDHAGADVRHGRVRDGVGAAHLMDYLTKEAERSGGRLDYFGPMTRPDPEGVEPDPRALPVPTIQIVEGATPEMLDAATRAVQRINAALPPELRLDVVVVPRESVAYLDEPSPPSDPFLDPRWEYEYPPVGAIIVQFAEAEDWTGFGGPSRSENEAGRADLILSYETRRFDEFDNRDVYIVDSDRHELVWLGTIPSARIWIDPVRAGEDAWERVLVHEILHALGRGHADPALFQSAMHPSYDQGNPGPATYALDREALLAAYGALGGYTVTADRQPWEFYTTYFYRLVGHATPETIAEMLGPWEDTSTHLLGSLPTEGGELAFGVARRNGLARPWASGPAPSANIQNNPELSGRAVWSGRLLGFTPAAEAVGGAADHAVQLATLDGALDFTALESWPTGTAPGAAGTGAPWGDGALSYDIRVRGNTFSRTGGDDGEVTGAFFGRAHQAMGGVVERDDLTAGFGGVR